MNHTEAVNRARLAAAQCGLKVFPRTVGLFYDRRGTPRKIGIPGEPDLQGWQVGTGRAVAIEVKTGGAHRRGKQTPWARAFEADGGLYVLARYSGDEDGDATIRAAMEAGS